MTGSEPARGLSSPLQPLPAGVLSDSDTASDICFAFCRGMEPITNWVHKGRGGGALLQIAIGYFR
jgi:hypothetical protein